MEQRSRRESVGRRTTRFKGNYPEAVADLPVGAGELVVLAGTIPPPTSGVGSYVPFIHDRDLDPLATPGRSGRDILVALRAYVRVARRQEEP